MGRKYADLVSISMKIDSPKIFPPVARIDLKKVKEFYFKSKEIFLSIDCPDNYEIEVMVEIFSKGVKKVGEFFSEWSKGKIQPTNEELELLIEACDEASNNFNILAEKFPSTFPPKDNKRNQEEIAKGKELILEEKRKRVDINNQWESKIKGLQSQINSLNNQPNNSDDEEKIKDLQRQIEELKKSKPTSPLIPNPDVPQQPTSLSPKKDNNNSLVGVIFLVLGVCFVLMIGFLVWQKKKKNKPR